MSIMSTIRPALMGGENFECPICGAGETEGGCKSPKECVAALSEVHRHCTRELVSALDNPFSANPSRLLGACLEALDVLGIGWLVCSDSGQLLGANRTAGEILNLRDGLALNADDVLCAPYGSSQPLNVAVQQAAQAGRRGEPGSHDAVLAVQRASGKRALKLIVRSVRGLWTTTGVPPLAALVLILDSAAPARATAVDLRELYGLTLAETRLANLLMEGKDLEDCCKELGIAHSTARAHLKRVFKKTGVRHQSELVSLLLKSIGLARRSTRRQQVN